MAWSKSALAIIAPELEPVSYYYSPHVLLNGIIHYPSSGMCIEVIDNAITCLGMRKAAPRAWPSCLSDTGNHLNIKV